MTASHSASVAIDEATLRAWPLPEHEHDADKEARGRVLVIAGSAEMPGAAVLAATAALRAGAGKLAVACPTGAVAIVAAALPEARVIALHDGADDNTSDGAAATGPAPVSDSLRECLERADAVLIGPGMQPEDAVASLVRSLLPHLGADTALVLDACAMSIVGVPAAAADGDAQVGDVDKPQTPPRLPAATVLTPHAGEMAHLLGIDKAQVEADAQGSALRAAQRWGVVVAAKGAVTHLAAPDGRLWCHSRGVPGLGTSGSGDVLAGIVAGLAARGAPVEQAAAWGIALHAQAGHVLAARIGPLGFLARELPAEVPAAMAAWSRHGR